MKRNGYPPKGRVEWNGIFDGEDPEALERIKKELLSK